MMTLETKRKDTCIRPRGEKISFFQLSQPPRHPKQLRKASLTKSLSPSTSYNSLPSQSLSSLCVSQGLVPSFLDPKDKDKLCFSFPNLETKKNVESNEIGHSPVLNCSPVKSFKILSPEKKEFVLNFKEINAHQSTASVQSCQSMTSNTKPLEKKCQSPDSVSKDQFNYASQSSVEDESKVDSFDLEFITPLLSDNDTTPESYKPPPGIFSIDNHSTLGLSHVSTQGKFSARQNKDSLDLMDLSSEDEKSTSSTQTISTLPSVISPTLAIDVPLNLTSISIASTPPSLKENHTEVSSKSVLDSKAPPFTSHNRVSAKLLQARMSLTGLSPPYLMTSEELTKKTITAPYTPLATPDLKIDLLESDPRRPSLVGRFSPPLIPPGFPYITPEDLTPEELHEFDMKWGSPHHARGRKTLSRPTLLALPVNRQRVTSLPNRKVDRDEEEEESYRLRHFSITGRGVVNRGDSFRSRRSKSNNSVASDVSSNEGWAWSHPCSLATSAASSAASSRASSASECTFPFRVVMLGAAGVGKTTLCHQFMTSEHINGYDSSLDDEYGEKSVSIMLDGEESEIQLIDHPADEMSVENYLATYNPHAIVVVFSVVDRQSFVRAEEIIQYLWRLDVMSHKGVILVANKTDLVRSRCIPLKESSNLADSYDCKFIETSSGLNHQVDELLVGVVKQIRLKIHNPDLSREVFRKRSTRRKKYRGTKTSASLKVKSLLTKVCGKEIKSKSCENLHVL